MRFNPQADDWTESILCPAEIPNNMIYRILANAKKELYDVERQELIPVAQGPLRGAWKAGLSGMAVHFPEIENRRVRFFFTEKGRSSHRCAGDQGRARRSRYPTEESGEIADLLPRR